MCTINPRSLCTPLNPPAIKVGVNVRDVYRHSGVGLEPVIELDL